MNKDQIKDKFSRIFKKGEPQPRNSEVLNKIFDIIKESSDPPKISDISKIGDIKQNTIRLYIKKYLEAKSYVRKSRVYTPPYLMIEPKKGEPDFVYGKDKRDSRIKTEKEKLEENSIGMARPLQDKITILIENRNYDGEFFKLWNEVVLELWEIKIYGVNKMRIGSGANRYKI